MRGSIDATDLGVRPGALDDQSKAFAKHAAEGGRPRHAGVPAARHLCRLQPLVAAPRAAVRRARRHPHRLWRRRPSADGRGRRAYRTYRARFRRRQPLDRRLCAGPASISAASPTPSIDNCQIVGSGKNGIALDRVGGRIERIDDLGRGRRRHLLGRGRRARDHRQHVSDCANGGILVHRWQPADDGTIVTGNRVERIAARRWRHRPVRQRHQRLSRRQCDRLQATRIATAPSPRSAPTAPATCRSPATPASRTRRDRASIPNSPSKAR